MDHIAIWPVISFIIFFLFFLVLLWWAFTADKKFIRTMSQMPLHDGMDTANGQDFKSESI